MECGGLIKSFLSDRVKNGNDSLMCAEDIVKFLNDSHLALHKSLCVDSLQSENISLEVWKEKN